MENKINNTLPFNGKLILDKSLFPHKKTVKGQISHVDKELLKNIIDKFTKSTSKDEGTLVVSSTPFMSGDKLQILAYYKNKGYIDSCTFKDNGILKNFSKDGFDKSKTDNIIEKLLKLFNTFKIREIMVTNEIEPLQKQMNKISADLNKSLQKANHATQKALDGEDIERFANFSIDGTSQLPYTFKNFNTIDAKSLEKLQDDLIK